MSDSVRQRYGFVDHMPTRSDMAGIIQKAYRGVTGIHYTGYTLADQCVWRFHDENGNLPSQEQMKVLRLLVRDLRDLGFDGVRSSTVRKPAGPNNNGFFEVRIHIEANPSLSIVNGKPTRTAVRKTHADLIVDELVGEPVQTYRALHDRVQKVDPQMTSSQWSNAIRWLTTHNIIVSIEVIVPDPTHGADKAGLRLIVLESVRMTVKNNAKREVRLTQILEAGQAALADNVRNGGKIKNDPDRGRIMAERDRVSEARARGRNAG